MTIEIHQPELEALIQRRMASGQFQSVEDLLRHAVETAPPPQRQSQSGNGKNLVEICAMVRGQTDDVDFSRNRGRGNQVTAVAGKL